LLGLGGMIAASALVVPPIYDTPEKVAGYARAIGTSPVSSLMSGRQAGIDTIGGIVANEISPVAPLGICLMAMSAPSSSWYDVDTGVAKGRW
jgi:ABC-2 type transport system permease protein